MIAGLASALMLAVVAAPGDDPVFTVTAPTGTYTASAAEQAHWTRIVRRSGATRRDARLQAFDLLVGNAWVEAEAAERAITISPEAARREFLTQRRQAFPRRRDFRRFLRESGQTEADLERRVRLDMLSAAIRDQVTAPAAASVTDAVIDDYVAEHGHERVPERRDIRFVLTKRRPAAVAAKRELRQGSSWSFVARRYSIDETTARRGGRLPEIERGALEPRVSRAVFGAPRRRIRGPVRTRAGYWVFSVSRIDPAHFLPEAASRRIIRERLVARAEEAAIEQFVAAFNEKWTSRTVCAAPYRASPRCAN